MAWAHRWWAFAALVWAAAVGVLLLVVAAIAGAWAGEADVANVFLGYAAGWFVATGGWVGWLRGWRPGVQVFQAGGIIMLAAVVIGAIALGWWRGLFFVVGGLPVAAVGWRALRGR